ncbi:hypothetical protein Poli38472_011797 [Pythium oligandrum]|uniref:Uncharacterized protein n=1 Tax=Pythium oligandrum TaxID=41045 RepID=A0A8K1C7R3_PYTOL|nr:hypothetical protein Poli38472_011797 [Pythium oligandrum]|eukprot:TMW58209.1 hypothetical protein Poli38472_011797 [Pythium oligandrum]
MPVAHLSRRRAVLSLTTRFCLPHEGMTELEYLSRGSAFLLDAASRPETRQASHDKMQLSDLKVLTCQHVACPWLFPKYFHEKWDWLQHVTEEFVQHSLQLLEMPSVDAKTIQQPKVLAEIPLHQQVWLHPDRDMAMLAIDEHDQARWEQIVDKWELGALVLDPAACKPGAHLRFNGHKQIGSSDDKDSEVSSVSDDASDASDGVESVGQYPKEVAGRFVGKSARGQVFAWSEEILEEGMCGGAVLDQAGHCVGLIEGIVPPFDPSANPKIELSANPTPEEREAAAAAEVTRRMQKALENHVAFIPSIEIQKFVEGKSEFILTGLALDMH